LPDTSDNTGHDHLVRRHPRQDRQDTPLQGCPVVRVSGVLQGKKEGKPTPRTASPSRNSTGGLRLRAARDVLATRCLKPLAISDKSDDQRILHPLREPALELQDTAATEVRSRPKRAPAKARSRTERARYNGRSREGVRVRVLTAGFRAALGGPTGALMELAIARASELVVIAEGVRARAVRGEPVDLDMVVKVENAARRAVADLGIKPAEREQVPGAR